MSAARRSDPIFDALLDALAPHNLRLPVTPPPRNPLADDDTVDPDAPARAVTQDEE